MKTEDRQLASESERLALYAFGWLMVALLIVMGHYVRVTNVRASASDSRVVVLEQRLALSEAAVKQLTTEHDLLMRQRYKLLSEIDRLAALPPKVIVVRARSERPTPIFESSYTVGR